jgi:hypothetical protein
MTRTGRAARLAWTALAFALIGWAAGCGDGIDPDRKALFPSGNILPTTDIVNPQLRGEQAVYNLLVSWKGHDEDGTLAGFEIAVDDTSEWTFTATFDSQFVFESKTCCVEDTTIPPGSTEEEIDSLAFGAHSLFVRAIDNEGAEDPTPAHITFTSTNIFPETEILRGPSQRTNDVTATTVILEWEGVDPDGVVSAYRYKLDDKPWVTVGADCTVVRLTNLTSAQFVNDPRGTHFFTVVSVDNAGAEERSLDPQKNTRQWESVPQISGSLRITSNVMGFRVGVNVDEGQIFEETLVSFSWRGDASRYGGVVQCYQYAYDQQEVFSGCSVNSILYPPDGSEFAPPIGPHTLFVRAFDDAGQTLNAAFPFVVVAGPTRIPESQRRVLYVDDYDEGSSSGGDGEYPSDQNEDAFWSQMLRGYPSATFDCREALDIPSVRIIGSASTVIWYVDAFSPALLRSNNPTDYKNPLPAYVNSGGNLILVGEIPTKNFTPDNTFDATVVQPGCPHMPRLNYSGLDASLNWFPAFCDTGLTFVYDAFKVSRSFGEGGVVNYIGEARRDTSTLADFPDLPSLTLDLSTRPPIYEGGPPYFSQFGLENCEQYDVRRRGTDDPAGAIPLWNYVDFGGSVKRTCGLYVPRTERRGHVLLLAVPPYFFKRHEVRQVIRTFLDLFGEKCQGDDCN